jgi:hypothetical protein
LRRHRGRKKQPQLSPHAFHHAISGYYFFHFCRRCYKQFFGNIGIILAGIVSISGKARRLNI